jgi:hypothetical protein
MMTRTRKLQLCMVAAVMTIAPGLLAPSAASAAAPNPCNSWQLGYCDGQASYFCGDSGYDYYVPISCVSGAGRPICEYGCEN